MAARLTATGNGPVIADALKWVSTACYNDGRLVAQVVLQPQDGIVLQEAYETFLPLLTHNGQTH